MRWFFRIVLTLAFGCLILLAAMPYLGPLERGWQDFKHAWELVRASDSKAKAAAPPKPELEPEPNRSREVIIPDEELSAAVNESAEDPFLAEARALAAADPEAAMDWLQTEASSTDRLRGMLEVVAIWAAQDSENALLWLESNAQGLARHETIHSGMELWSQQDPTAAAAWIEGMANDGSKATAAQTLIENWAVSEPEEASIWIHQLPPGLIRQAASQSMVDSMLNNDPKAAINWALQEARNYGDRELLDYSIGQLTQVAPETSEQLLREIAPDYNTDSAVDTYLQTLTKQDPTQASSWLANLDSNDTLYDPDLHTTFMREWSQSDSVAASSWLAEASSGPARDAAIIGFAETMIDYEPEAVAAWTNTISDPQTRVNWLTHAVQTWARTKPVETLRWLKETDLDPALRSKLARDVGAD